MSVDLMLFDPDTVPTVEQIYEILESDGPEEPLIPRMRAGDRRVQHTLAWRRRGRQLDRGSWASWPLAGDAAPPVIEVNIRWA